MLLNYAKYYVRVYKKCNENESWQTLGPYDYDIATELMHDYLKKGVCCWIENVRIAK